MPENPPSRSDAAASSSVNEHRDWPAEATALVVRTVDQVKTQTTQRATVAIRAIVYGLIVAIVGIALAFLLFIGLFRLVDMIREQIVEDAVWLTYLVLGLVFTLAGAIVFSRRKARL